MSIPIVPSTDPLPLPMVLYYLLLAPCLSLWYSSIFYCPTAYTYGILLSSTGSLPIPKILYYILLTPCLSLWYSTTMYWPTAYTYGTLLSPVCPLPIPMILSYLLLASCLSPCYSTTPLHCLYLWYSSIFYLPTIYPIVLYYLLQAPCLSFLYSIIVCWPTAYTYVTLLISTCSLPSPVLLYYFLLTHFLYLWYSTNFTGQLPIPIVLYHLLLAQCLYVCTYGTLLPFTGH